MWKNLQQVFKHPQYRSVWFMFGVNSLLFTFWITRLPLIKADLGLSEGELGMVLFFGPIGSLTAMFSSNWINTRLGEGRGTVYAMFMALIGAPMPLMAPNVPLLMGALFWMGFAGATMNVAMNAVVSLLEKRDRVHFMITCHGGWSLGGLLGSLVTSLLIGAQVAYELHWALLAALIGGWALWIAWPQLRDVRLEGATGPALVLPSRPVLGLALIGLFVMVSEGAAADWSGVYLAEVVGTNKYFIGFGYASFTLFMTLGRFYGDTLTARIGSLKVIRLGTALGASGLLLVLLPTTPTVLLGFGLMGLGFSCVVPVLFSQSGQVPGLSPSMGIAAVASAGYIGFLGGPVAIGLMAEHLGLGFGFGMLLLLTLAAFLFSPRAMAWAR
jgi:MFS family permease